MQTIQGKSSIPALLLATLTIAMGTGAPAAQESAKPIDIGNRREMFVDRFMIDSMEGTRLHLHRPHREGIALGFDKDKPWEWPGGYATIIKDKKLYRMYYRGGDWHKHCYTCYAESQDGIRWTRPDLGILEVEGTKRNNVVLVDEPFTRTFTPFLDTRPNVSPLERYKAVGGKMHGYVPAGVKKTGLAAFVSADGIHWKLKKKGALTQGAFDSQNVVFWSERENCYACYFRTWTGGKGGYGKRSISRATSPDFVNWSDPAQMTFSPPQRHHLYTSATQPYFRAPHIYIALPQRFFPGISALTREEGRKLLLKEWADRKKYNRDSSDAILMTSRGGTRYDRTFMEAFIPPGPSPRDWVNRNNMPCYGVVPSTDGRQMFMYRNSQGQQPTSHIARYSLRTDGFISVRAPYKGGEIITKPLIFSGKRLEINFATSAGGSLQVEIQEGNGKPLPGFALRDCPRMIGDFIDKPVSWKGGGDVSSLAGKPVRLRFAMKDADLYSFVFCPKKESE